MTMQYNYGRPRGSGTFFGVLLAMLLGATALGVFVHHARSGIAGKLAALVIGQPPSVVSAHQVLHRLQQLNRLQTADYLLDTVFTPAADTGAGHNLAQASSGVPALTGGSASEEPTPLRASANARPWMIVHGQILAGIDMSKLRPDNVLMTADASGPSIRLVLPPPEVFRAQLDASRTMVYAAAARSLEQAGPTLDKQIRQRAEARLQQAALNDGILDAATSNARETVALILKEWGVQRVEFR